MDIISQEKRTFVNKHVDLILCSNAMTLIQRKIFNVLLYNAIPNLKTQSLHEIKIVELAKMIGYASRNYLLLLDAVNSLPGLRVEWRIIDSKTQADDIISAACTIITSIFIRNGMCTYRYNEDILNQLHYPSIYGKLDLKTQMLFKSSFSLVLYEICEKFRDIGHTGWIDIEKVRSLMGVAKNSYKLYADFEKRVLSTAVSEINEKTKFKVEFQTKRNGRAVGQIRFIIQNNQLSNIQENILEVSADRKDLQLLRFLVDKAGFKPESRAINFIDQYGEELIQKQIDIIQKSDLYKAGKIRNLAGMIRDAVSKEGGYQIKSSQDAANNTRVTKYHEQNKKLQEERTKNELDKQYKEYINKKVIDHLELITEQDRLHLKSEFIVYCDNAKNFLALKRAQCGDFETPIVKLFFNKFIVDNYLQGRVMSKEQFVKNG